MKLFRYRLIKAPGLPLLLQLARLFPHTVEAGLTVQPVAEPRQEIEEAAPQRQHKVDWLGVRTGNGRVDNVTRRRARSSILDRILLGRKEQGHAMPLLLGAPARSMVIGLLYTLSSSSCS